MDKTELRAAGMHEVGAKLDDMLEAAKQEEHRAEGAIGAAEKSMQRVLMLSTAVDNDLDEGGLALEVATATKKYLAKAHAAVADLHKESQNRRMMARGMVMGMLKSVQVTKALHDQEQAKANGSGRASSDEEEPRRPGLSLKQQRQAETEKTTKSKPAKRAKKRV